MFDISSRVAVSYHFDDDTGQRCQHASLSIRGAECILTTINRGPTDEEDIGLVVFFAIAIPSTISSRTILEVSDVSLNIIGPTHARIRFISIVGESRRVSPHKIEKNNIVTLNIKDLENTVYT